MKDLQALRAVGEPTAPSPTSAPKTPPTALTVGAAEASVPAARDSVQMPTMTPGSAATSLSLSDPPASSSTSSTGAANHPWHLNSLTARYTCERVLYGKSDIHFMQPAYGTDLHIKDVEAQDRTSFEYLYSMPNGWPQLDEPQTSIGVGGTFDNGWGFEANLKHNKYIVKNHSQQNEWSGTLNGQDVSGTHTLGDYVGQYEISGGMNQISFLATKALPLPAFSPKDRFSLILKGGPGGLLTYTNSHLMNPSGTYEQGPRQYHLGGYSVLGETELRYEIRKRVALSLTNSFSYCHVGSSQIAGGGTAVQNILASQVALGVGYTMNFKDKSKLDPAKTTDIQP